MDTNLLSLIVSMLDIHSYYNLMRCNRGYYQVLSSLSYLQRLLEENDPLLDREDYLDALSVKCSWVAYNSQGQPEAIPYIREYKYIEIKDDDKLCTLDIYSRFRQEGKIVACHIISFAVVRCDYPLVFLDRNGDHNNGRIELHVVNESSDLTYIIDEEDEEYSSFGSHIEDGTMENTQVSTAKRLYCTLECSQGLYWLYE